MDHEEAVRVKAAEMYLLKELDPAQVDQFEEHFFGCTDCARDVRALSVFIEQSKNVLAEAPASEARRDPTSNRKGWLAWLRPTVAVPVFALLLMVVGYQNVVELPALKRSATLPGILPSASINIGTRGDPPVISTHRNQDFSLHLSLPPDMGYNSYTADLYNSAGRVEWSLAIPAETVVNDRVTIRVPGTLQSGMYIVAVHGTSRDGGTPSQVGQHSFELRLE